MSSDSAQSSTPPKRLGRYVIGAPLGRGGAGTVYRATLHGPGGLRLPVALKLLHDRGELLKREARLGGLLRHDNLIDVYEVGEHDGQWFCALELADCAIDALRPLPPRAVVEIGQQICAALSYAHRELGLIHLDLKPTNILLRGAVVKVADLGIARADGFERRGRVSGTPQYMSPEQRRGAPLDARSDIYSLGLTLRDLTLPPQAPLAEAIDVGLPTLGTHWEDETVDEPSFAGPAWSSPCPAWLRPVFERCTAHDPEDRFASMASLADALAELDVPGPELHTLTGAHLPATPKPASASTSHPFVGRLGDLAAVEQLVALPGLVTIRGAGGMGKSRLADEVAARFGGHVLRCSLVGIETRQGLLQMVARALTLQLSGSLEQQADQLGAALAGRSGLLLLMDNLEGVAAHADLLERWCAGAPALRILVTSRVALGCDTERAHRLGPMSSDDAVQLLAEAARARGVEADLQALSELSDRLDRLPLALVLAAGRMGVLSIDEIKDRLAPEFLRSGAEDRHGTMARALEGSWTLLDDDERRVLSELTVFRGGFDVPAAEAVCAGHGILEILERLERHSLITSTEGRFRLLELVRVYAAQHLKDEAGAIARHGAFAAALGTPEAIARLGTAAEEGWRQRLVAEQINLAVAVERALARQDTYVAVHALCASNVLASTMGPVAPALATTRRALQLEGLSASQACRLWLDLSALARRLDQLEESKQAAQEALRCAHQLGDTQLILQARTAAASVSLAQNRFDEAYAAYDALKEEPQLPPPLACRVLLDLGVVETTRGRQQEALAFLEASRAIAHQLSSPRLEGLVLSVLANVEHELGRMTDAIAHRELAIARFVEVHDLVSEASARGNQAASLHGADRLRAAEAYQEARRCAARLGVRRVIAITDFNFGSYLHENGEDEEAKALCLGALAYFESCGDQRWMAVLHWYLGLMALHEGALDEADTLARRAQAVHASLGDTVSEGVSLGLVGQIQMARGQIATPTLLRATELLCGKQETEWASAMAWLGEASWREGAQADAMRYVELGIHTLRASNHLRELAEALCSRARIRAAVDPAGATADMTEAAHIADALGLLPSAFIRRDAASAARVISRSARSSGPS
jgi:predicted ATPase